jgi:hypothetical protein
MKKAKFKVGDEVRIIKYGSLIWSYEKEMYKKYKTGDEDPGKPIWYDINPELVGQKGIVTKVNKTQGEYFYILKGPVKCAWYNEDQLKAVFSLSNKIIIFISKLLT